MFRRDRNYDIFKNLFVYSFGIALCISKTNHLVVVADAKH